MSRLFLSRSIEGGHGRAGKTWGVVCAVLSVLLLYLTDLLSVDRSDEAFHGLVDGEEEEVVEAGGGGGEILMSL
jgi:hypothetical protein